MMDILLIRHGYTKGNAEGRYVGSTDEMLLKEQADLEKMQPYIKQSQRPDAVYVSPMKRCISTCKLLYPDIKPFIIPDFREMSFGDFEYKNYAQLNGNPDYQKYIDSNGSVPFPNGESQKHFKKRCVQGFKKVMDQAFKMQWTKIAFVVHGGTIMAVLDAYAYPHRDYFAWQIKPGNGYQGRIEEKNEGMVISALHRIFDGSDFG